MNWDNNNSGPWGTNGGNNNPWGKGPSNRDFENTIKKLSTYGNNSSLDKFVYKKFNDETKESAIYYIAVHDQTDFSTKN